LGVRIVRGKSIAIAVAVLAVGAAPAVAKQTNALRSAPRTVAPKPKPVSPVAPIAPVVSQPAVTKPAVWIPSPSRGIKWSGVKYAVWIR
jgi:hypothetical protein